MAQQPWFAKFFNPKLKTEVVKEDAPERPKIAVNGDVKGRSGTEKFGGVFTEDYFRTLHGSRKAREYDKMRRGDARIKMCLSAIKNPIQSAQWNWVGKEADENSLKHAEFLNFIFKEDIGIKQKKDFQVLLNEALSLATFGFVAFERAHKVGMSHPKFGQYVGLKALGWRNPKTLEYFNTDENGELVTITQQVYGDIPKTVDIPAEFVTLMTLDQEGDNYEGISLLRPCYGPWSRKQVYLKLMAIGIERLALPTPKCTMPAGKEQGPEYDNLVDLLEKLTSHQSNYIIIPEGFLLEYLASNFDPEKVKGSIQFENEEMTFAFLANFLLLGAGGNAGAFALSQDLSDFFTNGILYIANMISNKFGAIGKELIELNFGPQESYPTLQHQGIEDKIGSEFGNLLKTLADGKLLTPDNNIEQELRRRLKLMPMREEDLEKRDKPDPVIPFGGIPAPGAAPNPDPEPDEDEGLDEDIQNKKKPKELSDVFRARLMLAESKAQAQIGKAQEDVRDVLQRNLRNASESIINQIIKNYEALPESRKEAAINDVSAKGRSEFLNEMKAVLADVARSAIDGAKKEIPPKKSMKFAAKYITKTFEQLPKAVQKRVLMQSNLMVTTTLNDLEKVVFLQYGDSVISTESAAIIAQDMGEAADTFVNGSSVVTAGGNAGSRIVNEARNAFFFDEEVLEEIESFTFINGDPVSPICQDLAGQTCSKKDVEAQRLFPPLHFNCKSYIVPNLVGDSDNPEVTGFKTVIDPQF